MTDYAIKVESVSKRYKLFSSNFNKLRYLLFQNKKYYQNFAALSHISLNILRGEVIGIIGRNGSGKSTLLKLISGIANPSSGKITVNGKISAILELGSDFNYELSGRENIKLSLAYNSQSISNQEIKKIVEFSELNEFIDQPVKNYSSGMQARLAFSIAISVEPEIMIVDEALSVGDVGFQRKCFSKIEDLRNKGVTIIYVSHNEDSIINICDRVAWLHNGKIILVGEPKNVTNLYVKYINENFSIKKIQDEYKKLLSNDKKIKNLLDKSKNINSAPNTMNFGSFNSSYRVKPKLIYKNRDISIHNPRVLDSKNNIVNILENDKSYTFTYDVVVKKTIYDVKFGFLLKRVDGTVVSGCNYPSRLKKLQLLDQNISIKFKIKPRLGDGFYFFNAGVEALFNGERKYAHRIIDCFMIRIVNASSKMVGIVDIVSSASLEK